MVTLRCACTNVEAGATSRAAISLYVQHLLRCKLPHDDLFCKLRRHGQILSCPVRSQLRNTPRPVEGSFLVSTTRLAANSGSPVSATANQYNSSISVSVGISLCNVTSIVEIWHLSVGFGCKGFITAFLLEVGRELAPCSVRILGHACEFCEVRVESLPTGRYPSAVADTRRHGGRKQTRRQTSLRFP